MAGARLTAPPRRILAVVATIAVAASACTSGGGGGASPTATPPSPTAPATAASAAPEAVTIEWWHIQNNDPGLSLWQDVADEFTADHPHVTIDITVQENDPFKTAITTRMQAGDVPDLFQSWGGGGLAEQVEAGLVKDITADVAPWIDDLNEGAVGLYRVDGKQYGNPFDLGMVGFWYNEALFAEAGITEPPATWDELLADVQLLKDAGITPIALGEQEQWPGMFYWAYLALRIAGSGAMLQAASDGSWDAPGFVQAGVELQRLIDLDPFQDGFLAAKWDGAGGQAATIAQGDAAFHLMGQWAPGTQQANTPAGDPGLGDDLGWFPFPTVQGGAGEPTDAFGGGNGFAVGKDAPAEAVEFLRYATSPEVADRWGETNSGILPVTKGSEASVTDPYLVTVLESRAQATYVQLYLDQATSPTLGGIINEAIAGLYAGESTPEEVAQTIAEAARTGS